LCHYTYYLHHLELHSFPTRRSSDLRLPQDGRIKLITADNNILDYRVSAIPTLFGEKIVLRVIDSAASIVSVDELGFEPDQQQALDRKSTRLNSSHVSISYAVFCLKK